MCKRRFVSPALLIFLGFVFGAVTALIWYFGPVLFVRDMLPFALAFAIIIFIVTAILWLKCGYNTRATEEECHRIITCICIRKYFPIIMISAAVFIVFSLTVLASFFSLTVRAILAFLGSTSFWTMLISFITMTFCISDKHQ